MSTLPFRHLVALRLALLLTACLMCPARAATNDIVQMLVPGFTVRELPARLNNLNNLRFAPDGRLTALGYDGRVWLVKDTDGDGLEDTAEPYWEKSTLSVPVGMAWTTRGLCVSSKGKISLIRDADGDGRGDTEETLASGWPPTDVGSGGVDATAVTLDQEGNIYFGLLVADYSNAYRLRQRKDLKPAEQAWLAARGDKGGAPDEEVSLYDLKSQRGTIQKWNAKTRVLETIATGIRVPYALAFNQAGDLFNTDQEGETWMPHGNPLDELNHIIPGRNYGFPPRHEKWLPGLVSEPPVVGFGPQHQSACGFVFNEARRPLNVKPSNSTSRPALPSSPGQGHFGPKWWAGDAIVAGESRGKIWRVRLVKTPAGYVGKEQIIARLSMLTTDVAISPKGDLYVSCHSGGPDWGTGPNGPGKIFKITYSEPAAPQPVAAWAQGVTEVRVAFDRPVDPSLTNQITGQEIEFGEYVRAGDRHEVLKPPYQVVQGQEATPREKLKVLAASLLDEGNTLVLETEPNLAIAHYALTIPGVKAPGTAGPGATVELDYDLNGAVIYSSRYKPLMSRPGMRRLARQAGLQPIESIWAFWLPHPERDLAAAFVQPARAFSAPLEQLGTGRDLSLFITARFNFPGTNAILHIRSSTPFMAKAGIVQTNSGPDGQGGQMLRLRVDERLRATACDLIWKKGVRDYRLTYSTVEDPMERPVPPAFILAPWLLDDGEDESAEGDPAKPLKSAPLAKKAGLENGDWESGRELFTGERLKCATCHRVRGQGQTVGPDLSNLVSRDVASILRDIRDPNATINPDYVTYNVTRTDGETFTGFIRAQDRDALRVFGADGKEVSIKRSELKDFRPSAVSLMPSGLLDGLSPNDVINLLTYLTHEPPRRTSADARRVLAGTPGVAASAKKLTVVLTASKQDHGPGQHDYPAWQKTWSGLLSGATNLSVTNAWMWPSAEQFEVADVIVFYFWNHVWDEAQYRQLDAYLARGGGVVILHSATIADREPEKLAERIGLAAQPQRVKYIHAPMELKFVTAPDHPLTAGLPRVLPLIDEPYWPMIGDPARVELIATTEREGAARPMVWTCRRGPGRVFASIAGHYTWTLSDPVFRVLLLRGIAWAAGESPARLQDLATASQ